MYHHYFRYGQTEVANNVRVAQYVKNGLKPVGTVIGDCDDCGDMPLVTDGVDEYRTPELDNVPWVAGPDFDAPDFAGVMIKEVTGLEGSTTTVEVEEKIGDGGQVGTRRANSRVMAVTADVVGRTPEAASLGLEWLSAALHPPCSEGSDCAGDTLHLFTTCPVACVGLTDPDSPFVTTQYDEPAAFQTTAIRALAGSYTNLVNNPSGEVVGIEGFSSNSAFGAYITGSVSSVAPPTAVKPAGNLTARLSTPALALGQRTNIITATVGPLSAGWYEFSVWVYVPAATTLKVRAANIFDAGGPYTDVKDRWIRLTHRQNVSEGGNPIFGVDTEAADAAKAAGMFIYTDGWSIRKIPSFPSSANAQGSLSTSVDGWHGNNAFGNFTTPQAIEVVNFTSPSAIPGAPDNPRAVRVTWKAAKDPGTVAHAVYNGIDGVVPGQVYTVECDIYLTANSTEFESDGLFNSKGGHYPLKGVWQHVKHTFTTPNTSLTFGFTSFLDQEMGAGPNYMYIANLQISPGYGVEPMAFFDGALQDAAATNLAAGITAIPAGTATITPNQTIDGALWQRLNSNGGTATARVEIPLANLTSGRRYVASWEVYNPHQTKSRVVTVDWSDVGLRSYTLAPLEKRRIYSIGKLPLDATYRFTDIAIVGTVDNDEPIYFRDVLVRPDNLYDYSWAGAVEQSDSVATPTGTDFVFKPNAGDNNLFGPILVGLCDTYRVTWTVSSPTGADVEAWASASTTDGEIFLEGEHITVTDVPTDITIEGVQTPGFPDDWRPVLTTTSPFGQGANGRPLTVHALTVTHRPLLTLEDCIKPYRRTFHNVVTVEGPKVLEWLTLGDTTEGSTVARVEWTWVATDPHLWHDPIPIITGAVGKGTTETYAAPGVPLSDNIQIAYNSTVCARPAVTALTCADNTLGPGIVLPPQAPVLSDPSIMVLTGINVQRRQFDLPASLSPVGVGKLSWTFVNDAKPKFGIRVRIREDTDPAFPGTMPECTFVEEFTIEYLAPNQTLFIDGPGDDAYVLCGVDAFGDPIYADARKNLRGNYGGPFKNSFIGCGRPYFITVDIPNQYTTSPSNLSGLGAVDQGGVTWSVDLVRRA